jgi:nucleoside 2-deoxyribosyltransferase
MRIFISYKFSGEKIEDVTALLTPVYDALKSVGHEPYVQFFDTELQKERLLGRFKLVDYMSYAFAKLTHQDAVLVLLNANAKSEGMLLEVGYATARGIPTVAAVKEGVTETYLPTVTTATFAWETIDDLVAQVAAFDFASLKARTF